MKPKTNKPGKPTLNDLPAPRRASDIGGTEILRLAIDTQQRSDIMCQRAFEDPFLWGMLCADIARHVAGIYANENAMTEVEALSRVHQGFAAELTNPSTTVDTGVTK